MDFVEYCIKGDLEYIKKNYGNLDNDIIYNGLCSSCSYGHLEIVKYLLEKYPNINIHANNEEAFSTS